MSQVLIVHAHPEPESFCTAQAHTIERALKDAGHTVDFIDLYAEGWDPVVNVNDVENPTRPFKPQEATLQAIKDGTLNPEIARHLELVLGADMLILSFPFWWFSMPAITKGWIDRVWVMGGVFGGDYGMLDEAALYGKKALVATTTGGPEKFYKPDEMTDDMHSFLSHIHHGIFRFVGYSTQEPIITYAPAHLPQEEREKALEHVYDTALRLNPEPSS